MKNLKRKVSAIIGAAGLVGLLSSCPSPTDPDDTPKCVPGLVGNLAEKPTIGFVGIGEGAGTIYGKANNVDGRYMNVVLYAYTNMYYVQPYVAAPLTTICSDGSWKNTTHPWNRMVALLVDSSYQPIAITQNHPSRAAGILAWVEYP